MACKQDAGTGPLRLQIWIQKCNPPSLIGQQRLEQAFGAVAELSNLWRAARLQRALSLVDLASSSDERMSLVVLPRLDLFEACLKQITET
jgi:hypothetical protein